MQERIILDYGCGLGGNFRYLSRRGRYIGVDILEDNLSYARKRYGDEYFYLSEGVKVPFADGYFDEVHAYDVLEHVDELDAVIREIQRLVKPGGRAIFTIPAAISEHVLLKLKTDYFEEVGHRRIVDPNTLIRAFCENGFAVKACRKTRGIEAVVLSILFWQNSEKRMVRFQTGSPEFSKMLVAFIWLFDARLFRTPLRYLFFIYWLTLPVGWLVSQFFPKSYYINLKKC